jgi:rubrerythrin
MTDQIIDLSRAAPASAGPGLLDGIDPDLGERLSRREALFGAVKRFGPLATAPVLLAGCAALTTVATDLPQQVTDVLNFALTLEELENEFYNTALAQPNLVPAGWRTTFETISAHEQAHVAALRLALAQNAVPKPSFDFTAGGRFADVFSNTTTFLALSQAFEDTGVRAYKGQAANLMISPSSLTTALQIHSVEARHAAQVRYIRGYKPWITGSSRSGLPAAAQGVYDGEGATTQAGVSISSFVGGANASEAFDEPLSKAQVLAIAGLFIRG